MRDVVHSFFLKTTPKTNNRPKIAWKFKQLLNIFIGRFQVRILKQQLRGESSNNAEKQNFYS